MKYIIILSVLIFTIAASAQGVKQNVITVQPNGATLTNIVRSMQTNNSGVGTVSNSVPLISGQFVKGGGNGLVSPTLDGGPLTNLTGTNITGPIILSGTTHTISATGGGTVVISNSVAFPTNTTTLAPDFSIGYGDIVTNAAFTVLAPINLVSSSFETCVMLVTNSTGSAVVITPPSSIGSTHIQGVWYVTNQTAITFSHDGLKWTNATCFPMW